MHPRILAGAPACENCHNILLSYGQCSQPVKSVSVSQRSSGTPGAAGSSLCGVCRDLPLGCSGKVMGGNGEGEEELQALSL